MKRKPTWRRGTWHWLAIDAPQGFGLIEIFERDACWAWQLFLGVTPKTYGDEPTLAAAKRAALREAKRLGWVP